MWTGGFCLLQLQVETTTTREEDVFVYFFPETCRWACKIKTSVCLYQISSAVIPEAGEMLQPILLSARSPIKLWLQSKILSLYIRLTLSPRAHSTALTADWSVLRFLILSLLPSRKGENGKILVHSSCFGVFVTRYDCRSSSSCLHVFVKSGRHFLFHIFHPDQPMTMYELKSSVSPFPLLSYPSVWCICVCLMWCCVCVCVLLVADWCVCLPCVVFHPLFRAAVWTGIG